MTCTDPQRFVRSQCALIHRTREEFGALGNMAGGYPISLPVIGTVWTSEALFQALRFPEHPDIQEEILREKNGYAAKCKAKKDRRRDRFSRPDWSDVCVEIMRFCIQTKFVQHRAVLTSVPLRTQGHPIVELAHRVSGHTWGATVCKENPGMLVGCNHVGRIWMEIRQRIEEGVALQCVRPPRNLDLRLPNIRLE